MLKAQASWKPYGAMALGVFLIGLSALFACWAGPEGVPGPASAFYRLAIPLLVEPLGLIQTLGDLLVLGGIYLVNRQRAAAEPPGA